MNKRQLTFHIKQKSLRWIIQKLPALRQSMKSYAESKPANPQVHRLN